MIWCGFFVCVDFVCGTCTKMLVQFINSISLSHCKASQGTAEPPRPPAPAVHPHGTQRVGVRTRPSTLPSSTPEEQTNTSDLPHMSNPTITNRCMQREKSCLLGKKKTTKHTQQNKKNKTLLVSCLGGRGHRGRCNSHQAARTHDPKQLHICPERAQHISETSSILFSCQSAGHRSPPSRRLPPQVPPSTRRTGRRWSPLPAQASPTLPRLPITPAS